MRYRDVLLLTLGLVLSACGSTASAPAASSTPAPTSKVAAPVTAAASAAENKPGASGKPAPSGSAASAASSGEPKPEKAKMEVGIAAPAGSGYMVLRVAHDAGYFTKHGLDVTINVLSASTATEALISGKADVYQGGATAIGARLQGADVLYVAAATDKNDQMLIGQKGITTFEALKGKSVATTSPGAFGEIAMRKTAKEHNMEIPRDIKLLFHPTPAAAYSTFTSGQADAFILSPPFSLEGEKAGYPVIVDYLKEGLKIIGPGVTVSGPFLKQNPNTLKAYLEGYLDGLKRTYDDPVLANQLDTKYNNLTDPKLADADYEQGKKVWNMDMRVDPAAIQVVLDALDNPKAKAANPKDFYDNSIIEQVNKDYASKLFPEVK